MSASPVQSIIGLIVDRQLLVLHISHQLYYLPDGFSLSCNFGFCFCFGLGFCFRCKSLVCDKWICKLKQLLEVEGHSWLLVRTLVKKVGAEHGAVVRMKALPEEGIALPNRHGMESDQTVS